MAAGSAGLTQWSQFDVPGMWSLLQNVSTVDAFRQAGAWQNTYEAAQALAGRLRWYRDGLASKWSPEGSDAAAAYLGRLDELIGSAQQLADASVANRQALVTLANAVDDAQPKMQKVYEQSQALRQVGAAQPRAGATVVLRQQQLHQQATQIMESLGSAAMDSWRHFATVDDYQPPQSARGGDVPIAGAPTVQQEEFVSTANYKEASMGGGGVASTTNNRAPTYARRIEASTEMSAQTMARARGEGITLSRSPSSYTSALADRTAEDRVASAGAGARVTEQVNAGVIAVPVPESIDLPRVGPSALKNFSLENHVETRSLGLRAGGVIGGERSVEARQATAGLDESVNAVGGTIGTNGAEVGMMKPGNIADRRESLKRRREYDDQDPWYVAEGVLPVLRPLPEPTHFDPGPGVLGIDR
ncbi:hypothetical protein GCM10023322_05030 [Rugosimonospora acidiphila]|uniref:PPE family protein n=1 Tax=Rugosimonospora acidiphila TaxID=556531 RepID=A0ABP9RJ13_9ACTN